MKMFVHCPHCGSGFDAFRQQEMEAPVPTVEDLLALAGQQPQEPVHHFEMTESQPVEQPQFAKADYIDGEPQGSAQIDYSAEINRLNAKYDPELLAGLPEAYPGLSLEYDGKEWTGRRDHKVTTAPTLQGIVTALHNHQL